MDGNQVLALGLGLEAPWKLADQHLDTSSSPHQLHLTVEADRGSLYPCPECGQACPAHDYKELTWRHLNFSNTTLSSCKNTPYTLPRPWHKKS